MTWYAAEDKFLPVSRRFVLRLREWISAANVQLIKCYNQKNLFHHYTSVPTYCNSILAIVLHKKRNYLLDHLTHAHVQ